MIDGLDFRLCSCEDEVFRRDARGAALVIADPPWRYDQRIGASAAADKYATLPVARIVRDLGQLSGPVMALWLTGPLEAELDATIAGAMVVGRWRWGRHVTVGAWAKSRAETEEDRARPGRTDCHGQAGHYGQGYWWAGCAELVRVYAPGPVPDGIPDRGVPLRSAHVEPPGEHSAKPVAWQRAMIRRWTRPGDLVVDPYAGTGTVAEAAWREGRRSLSAEVDAVRHAAAESRLRRIAAGDMGGRPDQG